MAKLVVFKLEGNFATGFKVDVEIFTEDNRLYDRIPGQLPASLQLLTYLTSWQSEYAALKESTRIKGKKVIFTRSSVKRQLNDSWDRLQQEFQQWLQAESFRKVNLRLREYLNVRESIRILLCANDRQVHQLPWSKWDFIQRYRNAEIAFSKLDFAAVSPSYPRPKKSLIKILAILGEDSNINVAKDLDVLKSLPNVEVKPLIKPQREELYDCLWLENWDIVFFAGHSKTIEQEGIIYLNDEDVLTIADLQYGLERAIANGLHLAIFNSCDGLGLAYALDKLGLPQAIVMKEPVTDRVAHKFLGYFLTEYSSDLPLFLATRRARERLQALETKYSFNSCLPVLYQNQSAKPLLWSQLRVKKVEEKSKAINLASIQNHNWGGVAIAILLAWLCHTAGWLQTWELKSFDRAFILRPPEARDERILVITVDDRDIQYQSEQGMKMRGSLSDDALKLLLNKLQLYNPVAIASDIVHDFPYDSELKPIIARQDNFIAICRVQNKQSRLDSIAPPPGINAERLGFTNMAIDDDGVIRRHLLGMTPDRMCQSDMSLSLRMALKYLDYVAIKENDRTIYPRQIDRDGRLAIGDIIIPKIEFDSGAYKLPNTENRAYKTILNYRSLYPQTISLKRIIEEENSQELHNLIAEKIIFVGVKSNNNDSHITPYSNSRRSAIPGVLVHAQGTSQIISAVLDKRKLISWLPNYMEFLWIAVWGLIGSVVALVYNIYFFKHHKIWLFTIVFVATFILYLSYLNIFLQGYWLCFTASILGFYLSLIISLFSEKSSEKSKK